MEFVELESQQTQSAPPVAMFSLTFLYFEQGLIMCQKIWSQKQRNGRTFLKDSVMLQFFVLAFTANILMLGSMSSESPHPYQRLVLPPLSKSSNGIFNQDSAGNEMIGPVSQRLFYAPNNSMIS